MTPKEKAKDIFMQMAMCQVWGYGDADTSDQKERAKGCASICVDQIIQSAPTIPSDLEHSFWLAAESANKYWNEVKEEIEKL
jgi:hypothetical protein